MDKIRRKCGIRERTLDETARGHSQSCLSAASATLLPAGHSAAGLGCHFSRGTSRSALRLFPPCPSLAVDFCCFWYYLVYLVLGVLFEKFHFESVIFF